MELEVVEFGPTDFILRSVGPADTIVMVRQEMMQCTVKKGPDTEKCQYVEVSKTMLRLNTLNVAEKHVLVFQKLIKEELNISKKI